MSHFGRAVPITCRSFPRLDMHSLTGDRKLFVPSSESLSHIVLLFKSSQVHQLTPWLPLFRSLPCSSQLLFVLSPSWRLLHPLWRRRCHHWRASELPGIADRQVAAVYTDRKTLLESLGLLNPEITNLVLRGQDIECAWQGERRPQSQAEVVNAMKQLDPSVAS